MNSIINFFLQNKHVFYFFKQVYLFGSILYIKKPNDIDILLIYEKHKLKDVKLEKVNLQRRLSDNLQGINIDFTTLNQYELVETSFLKQITYIQIKD